jgi:hypothetical protein
MPADTTAGVGSDSRAGTTGFSGVEDEQLASRLPPSASVRNVVRMAVSTLQPVETVCKNLSFSVDNFAPKAPPRRGVYRGGRCWIVMRS